MRKVLFFLMILSFYNSYSQGTFNDVLSLTGLPTNKGYIREIFDYDNDGYEDLVYQHSNTPEKYLYKNNGNGTFTNVSSSCNFPINSVSYIFDFDNNGYQDLIYYVNSTNDSIRLFSNENGYFSEKTDEYGLSGSIFSENISIQTFGIPFDYDNDGDLDILFSQRNTDSSLTKISILKNSINTNGTFNVVVDLITNTGLDFSPRISITDYNNDHKSDILVITGGEWYQYHSIWLYENNADGSFTKVQTASITGTIFAFINSFDYNNDGNFDLMTGCGDNTTYQCPINRNNGDGTFTNVTSSINLHQANNYYEKIYINDFDNDGDFDVFHGNMHAVNKDGRAQLWENLDGEFGSYAQNAANYGINIGNSSGDNYINSEWFDYDNDGDLDLFIQKGIMYTTTNTCYLMENNLNNGNNYLRIKLVGCSSPKDGRGSKVTVVTNGKRLTQYFNERINNHFSDIFHFGVGTISTVDSVIVYWPSGNVTGLTSVDSNQFITVYEDENCNGSGNGSGNGDSCLIADYPFTGSAVDVSGNENHGIISGVTPTQDRFGNDYSAYSFDGVNDFVNLDSLADDFANITDFTISFWMKADLNNQSQVRTILFGANTSTYDNRFLVVVGGTTTQTGHLMVYNQGAHGANYSFMSTEIIGDDTYHHIGYVRNGSIGEVYIDGILVGTHVPNYNFSSTDRFSLGQEWDAATTPSDFYNGILDDVKIYQCALDSNEIQDLYNDGYCFETVYQTIYDTVYVSVTDTLIIDVTLTGIPAPNNVNTVKVYPNPTSDYVVINTGDYNSMNNYAIKIMNSLSQIVWESFVTQQEYQIDVNSFGGYGTYFINIYDDSGTLLEVKKLILQ